MKFKKNDGFTLVELIVVIAILAILAGVAVPAYSGYVAKAEKAGDLQLLGAVNQAFGAACLQEGIATDEVVNAHIVVNEDGSVGTVNSVTTFVPATNAINGTTTVYSGANVADIAEAFTLFFSGNENAKFKVMKSLVFDAEKHCFVDATTGDGTVKVFYGGQIIELDGAAVQALAQSSFGAMGSETLLGQVGFVTDLTADLLGAGQRDLATYLYGAAYTGPLFATLTEEELDRVDAMTDEEYDQFLAHSLVLTVATQSQSVDTDQLYADLASGALSTSIRTGLATDVEGSLTQAALAYGMYSSYMYNVHGQTTTISGLAQLEAALEDPEFQAYVQEDRAQQDLDAYMQALDMIGTSAPSGSAAASDILFGGFEGNDELAALLGSMMGR